MAQEDGRPPALDDIELVAWPQRRHDLTAAGSDWTSHALIGWQAERLYGRMAGYRRAAEILGDHILDRRRDHDLDTVIFPFAGCWRHHIELRLKALLADLQRLLDLPVSVGRHHDIRQLWNEVRPLLVRAHPGEERRDRSTAGRLIGQLADMDPDGQHFRYAHGADGSATLPDVDRLDIREFEDALQALANYLEAAAEATSWAQDNKNDAMEEMTWAERDMMDEMAREMAPDSWE